MGFEILGRKIQERIAVDTDESRYYKRVGLGREDTFPD